MAKEVASPAAWLVASAGFLVAWSWARLLLAGHPSPDLGALPFPLDLVGVTGFVAVVLVCLQAHRGRVAQAAGDAADWGGLTRESLALALVAGLMPPFLSGDLWSTLAYAAALPAGMYLAYLAGRPGPWPARLGRVAAATGALGLVVGLAYWPFWSGLDTLRVPLAFLAERRPTNGLGEIAFVALKPILGSAAATAALSGLGTLLTAGLALLGAVLAFRAPGLPALAGAMAGVLLLATTLAAPVFHPWYLIPSLVLAVELRDPAWRDWLLLFGTLSLLADGTVLLAYGTLPRAVYTVLAVALVASASLLGLRPRLRRLLDRGTGGLA